MGENYSQVTSTLRGTGKPEALVSGFYVESARLNDKFQRKHQSKVRCCCDSEAGD